MPISESDYLLVLERADGIDRLLAEGVPLNRIEELLDQLERQRETATAAERTTQPKPGLLGRLRWS